MVYGVVSSAGRVHGARLAARPWSSHRGRFGRQIQREVRRTAGCLPSGGRANGMQRGISVCLSMMYCFSQPCGCVWLRVWQPTGLVHIVHKRNPQIRRRHACVTSQIPRVTAAACHRRSGAHYFRSGARTPLSTSMAARVAHAKGCRGYTDDRCPVGYCPAKVCGWETVAVAVWLWLCGCGAV